MEQASKLEKEFFTNAFEYEKKNPSDHVPIAADELIEC